MKLIGLWALIQLLLIESGFQSQLPYETDNNCGLTVGDKIVGGSEAGLQQFPWIVMLIYHEKQRRPSCSGTLINKRFVISAKHCNESDGNPIIRVRLGEHNWHSNPDQQRVHNGVFIADRFQEVEVESLKQSNNSNEEILLIMLKMDVEPTAFIKPLCLPTPAMMNETLVNKRVIAIGWGFYNGRGRVSDTKQWVSLTIKSADENRIITAYSEGRDTCNGDSGGPIMKIDPESARYFLVGVVWSGPEFCGHYSKRGAIYANVVKKQNWIREQMKDMAYEAGMLKA